MKISELIKELQNLPPSFEKAVDANDWLQHREYARAPLLDFKTTGKVIRTLLPILGSASTSKGNAFRRIYWSTYGSKHEYSTAALKIETAVKALKQQNLLQYVSYDKYQIEIETLAHYYPSAFYTSDDIEVWIQRNYRRMKADKIKQVGKKLDKGR